MENNLRCEMEDGDIRYIAKSIRETLKGYKKSQDKFKIYKGHILKKYNMKWLKQQSIEEQDKIIKELDFNLALAQMGNGQVISGKLSKIDMTDCIEIPLYPNKVQEKEEEREEER